MTQQIIMLDQYLSGINNHIYSQLNSRNWKINILNVPFPKMNILKALLMEFNLNIFQWKQNAVERYLQICNTSDTFIKRTIFCQKKLDKLYGKFDLIFQVSGMFAPTLEYENLKVPYVTFNDYTMALTLKYPAASSPPSQIQRWLELEKKLYQNASKIFTTSENTKKSIINDYNIETKKVILVRYGIPIEFNQKTTKLYSNNTILFIGRNFKHKGGFILLKAFQKVRNVIPSAKLIIVGVDKNIIQKKPPGVEILGFIKDRNKINNLFEYSTIFVMPSYYEAFGLVFLEAMIHKLPCIGTNIDAIPEIISDGETGFLIRPDDVDELANKIIILLKNPELSKKMGLLGYEKAKNEFSWNEFGEKIDKNLKELI